MRQPVSANAVCCMMQCNYVTLTVKGRHLEERMQQFLNHNVASDHIINYRSPNLQASFVPEGQTTRHFAETLEQL